MADQIVGTNTTLVGFHLMVETPVPIFDSIQSVLILDSLVLANHLPQATF
jgi:hypothetical protein